MDISKAGDVIERMKWAALKKYFTSKGRGVRQCIRILCVQHYDLFIRYMITYGTGSDWIRERMVERSALYIGPPSFFFR